MLVCRGQTERPLALKLSIVFTHERDSLREKADHKHLFWEHLNYNLDEEIIKPPHINFSTYKSVCRNKTKHYTEHKWEHSCRRNIKQQCERRENFAICKARAVQITHSGYFLIVKNDDAGLKMQIEFRYIYIYIDISFTLFGRQLHENPKLIPNTWRLLFHATLFSQLPEHITSKM